VQQAVAPNWRTLSLCAQVGGNWWFPDVGESIPAEATKMCSECPVIWECANEALTHPDSPEGFWAGCGPGTLRRLRHRILRGKLTIESAVDEAVGLCLIRVGVIRTSATECENCGRPLPPSMTGRTRRYCDGSCRKSASKKRLAREHRLTQVKPSCIVPPKRTEDGEIDASENDAGRAA
jgi:hypothetical protein